MTLIWPVVSNMVGAVSFGRAKNLALATTLSYGDGLIGRPSPASRVTGG